MTDPKIPHDDSQSAAEGTDASLTTRFVSSRPPQGMPSRTLIQWVQMFSACPHPPNGVVPAVLVDADETRAPFEWCGTCGGVRFPNIPNSGWTVPGLAILFQDGAIDGFARSLASLSTGLAELLESARAIKSVVGITPGASPELLEKIRLFEVDCFQVEQGAKGCLGELTTSLQISLV